MKLITILDEDMAGKWRAVVELPDGSNQIIKFDHEPKTDEITQVCDRLIVNQKDQLVTQIDAVKSQIDVLTAKKDVLTQELATSVAKEPIVDTAKG